MLRAMFTRLCMLVRVGGVEDLVRGCENCCVLWLIMKDGVLGKMVGGIKVRSTGEKYTLKRGHNKLQIL